jgi:flagellin-like protein
MKNTKGLSGIVTTLIIILLVFVAVAALWGTLQDLLGGTTSKITTSQTCMDIEIIPSEVSVHMCDYFVTFERTTKGIDEVYLKIILLDEEGERSPLFDSAIPYTATQDNSPIGLMERRKLMLPDSVIEDWSSGDCGVMDGNAVSLIYTPYFIDEKSGKEVLCDSRTYDFKATRID